MIKEAKRQKNVIQSVLLTLNIQALIVCSILVFSASLVYLHIRSFFNSLADISYDLGAVIVERYSEQPNEQQAMILANEYSVLIAYRQDPVGWYTDGNAVYQFDNTQLREGVRHRYTLNDGGLLYITWEIDFLTRAGHGMILIIWIVSMVTVLIVVVLLIRKTLSPLRWMQPGIEQLTQGNFHFQAPTTGKGQIDLLASQFNEMTTSVSELIKSKDQLVADVGHELRSPITKLKLALELLPEDENVRKAKRNVSTIEEIITMILEGQRINQQTMELSKSQVNLTALLNEVISLNCNRLPGIKALDAGGEVTIDADGHLLKLLLHNLVENALKYSLPNSQPVEVSLFTEKETVSIIIGDDGIGVAEENLQRIFEPFYKVAPERGFNKGYGLGLSLCKRICDVHQWSITVRNRKPRGFEVVIKIDRINSRHGLATGGGQSISQPG